MPPPRALPLRAPSPRSADLASMDIEDGGKGLEYNPMDAQVVRALPSRYDFLPRSTIWPLPLPLFQTVSGPCPAAVFLPLSAR